MKYFLGIDPGLTGALALYDPAADRLHVIDMPTHPIRINGSNKNAIDVNGLANFLDGKANDIKLAVVEEVGAMPKQGVTSSFNFGFAAGCAQMAVAAYFIQLRTVRPATWKREMGVTKDKETVRREASRLMPNHSYNWPLKKHDGRAEAALLAYYAAKKWDGVIDTGTLKSIKDLL